MVYFPLYTNKQQEKKEKQESSLQKTFKKMVDYASKIFLEFF